MAMAEPNRCPINLIFKFENKVQKFTAAELILVPTGIFELT
jgi:hypothetical protein